MNTNRFSGWLTAVTIVAIVGFGAVWYTLAGGNEAGVGSNEPILGAVSSLDAVDLPFVSIGGKKLWVGVSGVIASSTNVCVFKNPFGSEAIIDDIKVSLNTNNHGAIAFDVSTSTTGNATSTGNIIGRFTGAAAGTITQYDWRPMWATSSEVTAYNGFLLERGPNETGTSRMVLGDSEYIIVRAATSTAGGSVFPTYSSGGCGYELSKI